MAAPTVQCPTCQRPVTWTDEFPFRPFCSERCRMVDLGAWFAEERKVPGEPVDGLEGGALMPPRHDS
jgi:endogenous inhibitor of DNA gyrase (YacG/DUF329 family)